eukprot:141763-Rhodomonas_salina.1
MFCIPPCPFEVFVCDSITRVCSPSIVDVTPSCSTRLADPKDTISFALLLAGRRSEDRCLMYATLKYKRAPCRRPSGMGKSSSSCKKPGRALALDVPVIVNVCADTSLPGARMVAVTRNVLPLPPAGTIQSGESASIGCKPRLQEAAANSRTGLG